MVWTQVERPQLRWGRVFRFSSLCRKYLGRTRPYSTIPAFADAASNRQHSPDYLQRKWGLVFRFSSLCRKYLGGTRPHSVYQGCNQAFARSERLRLLTFVESSLNEIYLFDAQTLRFQYANTGDLRNQGYSLETVRAMTPVDITPEIDYDQFRQIIAPLLRRDREKLVFQTAHQRADGSLFSVG